MNIKFLSEWIPDHNHPLIVAGPCSAESEQQVLSTAVELSKNSHVKIFRAGIWKPRSEPNGFEGVGVEGLKWLQKVKEKTGLLTAVEVGHAAHVHACLEQGVDILWIGARTTVNPFYVQEIADAIKGRDVPVLVKNPINPDLNLWIGAIKRLNQAGITKLAAVHRGFSTYEKTKFRYAPNWQIPVELHRRVPGLPIICDPSHIAGTTSLIYEISQKALDLDMSGLMIETHINPRLALSDASQQVTPLELMNLLSMLIIRKSSSENTEFEQVLDALRKRIDRLDSELIEAIASRMQIVKKIGEYKKQNNVKVLQANRWNKLLEDRLRQGLRLDLDESFVKCLFEAIHEESLRIQSDLLKKED